MQSKLKNKKSLSISPLLCAVFLGFFALGGAVMTTLAPTDAQADAAMPKRADVFQGIMVVDLDKMVADSKVGKDLRDQVAKYSNDLDGKAQKENDAIEKEAKNLVEQQKAGKISGDDLNKAFKGLQERKARLSTSMQRHSAILQIASNKAQTTLNKTIQDIINKIEGDTGFLVFSSRAVLSFKSPQVMDITTQALGDLDKVMPKLQLDIKGAEAELNKAAPQTPAAQKK